MKDSILNCLFQMNAAGAWRKASSRDPRGGITPISHRRFDIHQMRAREFLIERDKNESKLNQRVHSDYSASATAKNDAIKKINKIKLGLLHCNKNRPPSIF